MKCPYCHANFDLCDVGWITRKIKRLELIETIINNLNEKIGKEYLFRSLRRKGYPRGRKTFTRDLKELENKNKLKIDVLIGGKYGSTTFVYKKEVENEKKHKNTRNDT